MSVRGLRSLYIKLINIHHLIYNYIVINFNKWSIFMAVGFGSKENYHQFAGMAYKSDLDKIVNDSLDNVMKSNFQRVFNNTKQIPNPGKIYIYCALARKIQANHNPELYESFIRSIPAAEVKSAVITQLLNDIKEYQ